MKRLITISILSLLVGLQPAFLSGQNNHILQYHLKTGPGNGWHTISWDITASSLNTEPIYRETHQVQAHVGGFVLLQLGSKNALDSLVLQDTTHFVRFWIDDQPLSLFKLNRHDLGLWLNRDIPAFTLATEAEIHTLSSFVAPLPFGIDFQCNDYLFDRGKFYRTTLIGAQCWMAENLNVGTRINGRDEQGRTLPHGTDCLQIKKNCYYDDERNCDWTGGLYVLEQAMCGAIHEKAQGICPPGWHIPSHNEWTILERFICQSAGNAQCEQHFLLAEQETRPYNYSEAFRGTNEGALLRASFGWGVEVPDEDPYGFSALPGRIRWSTGTYRPPAVDEAGAWHSSTQLEKGYKSWHRLISPRHTTIIRGTGASVHAISVRCLRDE